ncbi:flagellar hook-associated protein FlgL [Clostridium botulinum]|uniref:flagellar hook-associated protein FlgL n=1 Tax=Clostridium botulinum TaxID=1491 RepID=UPI0002EE8478|nr:flagellar hook-associated protein FlgL [Clostridium botulinum]KEH98568.1 flagellin [Clostridium botulinum D str. 16868]KLU75614.1 flagellin [Clostridium botulinum V891]KOA75313.1 flagellin [Clostridium botulinum]KOA93409.1 flagellin [Clostridium botulinum]MCD3201913.1 flagellar hook-associated protein 3 [Clostridium botulinum C/D]
MRVTNKMLSNNFLADMKVNLENINKIQQQNTSGKKFRKPSDDPFAVARSMQLHTDINTNKQYSKNITDVSNWLDTTDTALGQAGNVLQRVRELLISSGNGGYTKSERRAIKDEINEKIGEMSQILNTNFGGNYIFGGSRSTTKPMEVTKDDKGNVSINYILKDGRQYSIDSSKKPIDIKAVDKKPFDSKLVEDEYNQIASKLKIEVSQGVTMDYNVTATDLLEFKNEAGDAKNLREILSNIVTHLDSEKPDEINKLIGEDLTNITDSISNVLKIRAEVGAKQNRIEGANDRNKDGTFNMTKILSKHEDVNYTENMTDYATMLTVYMASLQTSAKIIQPSLMDYLR